MRIRRLGRRPYDGIEAAMRDFTAARGPGTEDELWLVEHDPVFTQGIAGRAEHVRGSGDIPVVATLRGGQVTYHGPGQVVAYPLIDLGRAGCTVKEYVHRLEEAVVQVLASVDVTGQRVRRAPGVYVRPAAPGAHATLTPAEESSFAGLAKIAALGVKIAHHHSYHGLALNVAMDLEPFSRIDPCGYPGLAATDLASLGVRISWDEAAARLAERLQALLRGRCESAAQ